MWKYCSLWKYCSWFPNDPVIADGIFYVRCLEVMINLSDVNVDGIFEWIIILTNWPFCLFLTKKFNDFIVVIMRYNNLNFHGLDMVMSWCWILWWWCNLTTSHFRYGNVEVHYIVDVQPIFKNELNKKRPFFHDV